MDSAEFLKYLNEVKDLMKQEKYSDAIVILDKLIAIDQDSEHNFNYNLVHQLYQLDSNCRSSFQQQIILEHLKEIQNKKTSISFDEIHNLIRENTKLNINYEILRREVELLILKNLIKGKIERDQLFFSMI